MRNVRIGSPQALPIQEATQGRSGSGISVDYRGEEVLAVWRHLPSMNWGMVTKIDTREAFAPVIDLQITLSVISLIVLVFVVSMALLFTKSIADPIRTLQAGAEVIGKGDLNHKVGTATYDEIGQLSRAFDTMVESLKEKTEALQRQAEETGPLQRRTGTVCLRGVTRPAGTFTCCVRLFAASGEALQR